MKSFRGIVQFDFQFNPHQNTMTCDKQQNEIRCDDDVMIRGRF